jgi:hypothetical protein
VLRFWNNQVFEELDSVLEAIAVALLTPTPHPNPPPQGGRAPETGGGAIDHPARPIPTDTEGK